MEFFIIYLFFRQTDIQSFEKVLTNCPYKIHFSHSHSGSCLLAVNSDSRMESEFNKHSQFKFEWRTMWKGDMEGLIEFVLCGPGSFNRVHNHTK